MRRRDHAPSDTKAIQAAGSGTEAFFRREFRPIFQIGRASLSAQTSRLDKGILNSCNGILVVSPDSLSRPWVAEEYAAMITRAVAAIEP